jgi:ABC-type polysaccharide/polyol phosphate transport system ATPase subunit
MPADNATASPPSADQAPPPKGGAAPAIQVEGLHKSFRIPIHRVDSFKERAVRPFAARDYRELRALDGVSFEIQQGEFFGIVGRNGSGKSTLLKLLASIYKADAGAIRIAGRLAPFIELGVGFNVELSARENAVLNGVMMGLTPKEARQRLGAVLEFAELEEFVDLKLKNYSSGMLVRLAFSLMLQADADVLLIDEVLAVGDAAFQQKCADAFYEMKAGGKTIVLVTHDMPTVESYCDRAMLFEGGEIRHIGDPAEVGRRYMRLNFEPGRDAGRGEVAAGNDDLQILDIWLEDREGRRAPSLESGDRIRIRAEIEVRRALPPLSIAFLIANADGVGVFEFGAPVTRDGTARPLRAGEHVQVRCDLENPLAPGRYFVHCGLNRNDTSSVVLHLQKALDFVVFGAQQGRGIVHLEHESQAVVKASQEP